MNSFNDKDPEIVEIPAGNLVLIDMTEQEKKHYEEIALNSDATKKEAEKLELPIDYLEEFSVRDIIYE